MLVELMNDSNEPIWINRKHVLTVSRSAMDSGKTLLSTTDGDIWVLGTPDEVAAKLNGEAK